MSQGLDATEQAILASRNLSSVDAGQQQQYSKVWHRFVEGKKRFSVEQVGAASSDEEVNACLLKLLREWVWVYMVQDSSFCESEIYKPLCEEFIDKFLLKAQEAKSSLVNENNDLQQQLKDALEEINRLKNGNNG